jgi:hypothetical protein
MAASIAAAATACARAKRPASQPSSSVAGASLWQSPGDLAARDLFDGPWGAQRAPDPEGVCTFVEHKHSGVNRGMTVVDSKGREWSVKQGYPSGLDDEGPSKSSR